MISKERLISIYLKLLKIAIITLGVIGVLCILIAVTVQGSASFVIIPGIPSAFYAVYWGVIYIFIQQVKQLRNRMQLILYYLFIALSLIPLIGLLIAPIYFGGISLSL